VPGGILGLACGDVQPSECTARVDVYIALSLTAQAHNFFTGGAVSAPPYHNETEVETVNHMKQHFYSLGADRVFLTLHSEEHMRRCDALLMSNIAKHSFKKKNVSEVQALAALQQLPRFPLRWPAHFRMLYLRHRAYAMSRSEEGSQELYTYYMYVREDNVFLEPRYSLTSLAAHVDSCAFPDEWGSSRHIAMDAYCHEAPDVADKVFFAGRFAMQQIFGPTHADFLQNMVWWIHLAVYAGRLKLTDPLSTEGFYYHLLHHN
ncbi:unnamed protein product, partial [Polarella glacialis]